MTNPFAKYGLTETDANDALLTVGHMLTGTKMLQQEPGVVYDLAAQQARPQDAGAIDQFMQTLDAERQVQIARASVTQGGGGYIHLTQHQQNLLDAEGYKYDDVLYSKSTSAAQLAAQQIESQSGGAMTAKLNADGTLALDQHGNIQPVAVPKKSSGGSSIIGTIWDDTFGSAIHGAKVLGEAALTGMSKAYNFGMTVGSYAIHGGGLTPGVAGIKNLATDAQQMQAQGYDPNSTWSQFAFLASGNAHNDLSRLNDQYGQEMVNQALQFQKDPGAFKDALLNDPANYVAGTNNTVLSAEGEAKLAMLKADTPQGKQFATVVRRVSGQTATPGNDLMNAIGVDPVKHPLAYSIGTGVTNFAASFLIDPTNIVFSAMKAAKLAAVGLDTLGDSERAASILTRKSNLPWVQNVQRGWQRAIDYGAAMRKAHADGNAKQLSVLQSQFTQELPGLAPLMGEFSGLGRLRFVQVAGKDGAETMRPEVFTDGGIQNMDDAVKFVRSSTGLNLLKEGRAATQSSLMPGALSAFGYRKFKAATAGWMTSRSFDRAEQAKQTVLGVANADPLKAEALIKEGVLTRFIAGPDDAVVAHTGQVLADKKALLEAEKLRDAGFEVPPGESSDFYDQMVSDSRAALADSESKLASAQRAAGEKTVLGFTPAGEGDLTGSLRGFTTNTTLDQISKANAWSPIAVAARGRLAAQRLSIMLPRNTLLNIKDTDSADKVFKYAMTYLNRGDAAKLRALWISGTSADRKQLVHGLVDQVGHAAGLAQTDAGREFLDQIHTKIEHYAAGGDELMVNGKAMALTQGQTQTQWILPSFVALRKSAAKLGLLNATFGKVGDSEAVDKLMATWKSGMLAAPKTAIRNMIEGWLRAMVEGQAGKAVQAKAIMTARNKELWDIGYEAKVPRLKELKAQYDEAVAVGDKAKAKELANGSLLAGEDLGRGIVGSRIADFPAIALVARAYRGQFLKHMDERRVQAILDISPDKLAEIQRGYHARIMESDMGWNNGAKQASQIAKAGFGPAHWFGKGGALDRQRIASKAREEAKRSITSWTHKSLDDTIGATRYSKELGRRVNEMPETTKAILDHIEGGKTGDLSAVIAGLEKEAKDTEFGKVDFPDPIAHPNEAVSTTDPMLQEAGKTPYARKLVQEFEYMLTGRNGEYQSKLAGYIRKHGHAPSDDWITRYIKGDNRPETALAPEIIALPNGGVGKLAQAIQDTTGAAFHYLIERTIQRTTSMPIYMANYAEERVGLEKQVAKWMDNGFSAEAATAHAEDLAMRRAFVRTEQIIDDPGQKTQFDVIARNFFPWSRAVSAMIRRWGAGLWQNPQNARRLMLAYEGAVHSGIIYTNAYGEPTFTYPGSGVFAMAMEELSKVPGFGGIAQFPMAGDLSGSVIMAVPGADNPFRLSMGPILSIPLREVYKHLLPTSWRGDLTKADELINGPIGVGDTFGQLMPSYVRRGMAAFGFTADAQNASLASAMNGANAYLAAAGLVPPPDATNDQLDQYRTRLQTQTKSLMFLRFVTGMFLPSAPSLDSGVNESAAQSMFGLGSTADFAWQQEGVKNLSDEFKSIVNEVHGDFGRAMAIWTYLHPDEVIYKLGPDGKPHEVSDKMPSAFTVSQSESVTHGAYLPNTDSAMNWLNDHAQFVDRYKSVSAYFLPQPTISEPYSNGAYKAELEFGLRVKKTPDQFLKDIYIRHAEGTYYPTVQEWDQKIQAAQLAGDTATYEQLKAGKSQWEKEYLALNPQLAAKQRQDHFAAAQDQLASLKDMLKNNDVPDGLAPQLSLLVQAWDSYEKFISQNGGHTTAAIEARSNAFKQFNAWAQAHVANTPLVDLYNGVFRSLNTNLDQIQGGTIGG